MSDVETVVLAMPRAEKDQDGVQRPPAIVDVATYEVPAWPGWHVASGEEIEEYETYWKDACPRCGKERGECQMSHS